MQLRCSLDCFNILFSVRGGDGLVGDGGMEDELKNKLTSVKGEVEVENKLDI